MTEPRAGPDAKTGSDAARRVGVRSTGRPLSDYVREELDQMRRDGLARRSLEARYSLLLLFRFLECDPPVRDLIDQTPHDFIRWLRETPMRRNPQGIVPKEITRESVRRFLAAVGQSSTPPSASRLPSEQTVGRHWRAVGPLFRRIGLDTTLGRREKISGRLLPVRVPTIETVGRWWDGLLDPRRVYLWRDRRRALRVVRLGAMLLLTGLRLGELLAARSADVEGRWLLLRASKTGPRIVYLSRRALAIAEALRRDEVSRQALLFDSGPAAGGRPTRDAFVAGWAGGRSAWSTMAGREWGRLRGALWPDVDRLGIPEKPQQTMRQMCSTWMLTPPRRDEDAERLQLGHGGTLQQRHYVDAMIRLPALLEPLGDDLPAIREAWPAPADVALAMPDERRGGIWDELRWLLAGGTRTWH